jgi:hypothetical protein
VTLDADVLAAFARDVLTPDVVEATVRRAIELEAAHPDEVGAKREALLAERRRVESELGHFTEAIRQGGSLPTLVNEMQRLEGQRADLLARLEHLEGLSRAAGTWDQVALREEFTALLREWQTLLQGEPVQARQILRKLIVGRLRMGARRAAGGTFLPVVRQASYGRLLAGLIGVQGMVPPGSPVEPDTDARVSFRAVWCAA